MPERIHDQQQPEQTTFVLEEYNISWELDTLNLMDHRRDLIHIICIYGEAHVGKLFRFKSPRKLSELGVGLEPSTATRQRGLGVSQQGPNRSAGSSKENRGLGL